MKKQYSYVKLMPRLLALQLDTCIIGTISHPFRQYVCDHLLRLNDLYLPDIATLNLEQLKAFFFSPKNITYCLECSLVSIAILFIYFVGFWIKFDTTIGKLLMGIKIIDSDTFTKPTKSQYIKRFFGYSLGIFSLLIIPFDKHHRGLHDKIAGTTIIKI
ncbi:RDD family protein [Orientia tsutsugamushi str. Gilliam]|uniref:RDD family protein n=1 Tax=Orientia tsutsugamushi str. Gilliam TaxID=1359184 RepID=A0A0F3MBK2_ORITS|nr:RDD family protein [Orientia tsutsugamushi]KJV53115.1 RDD family protein [Orientia tsutsugamushi str. Gilliam]SPR04141.1 RDD family protein [Orientia tsutsugamushi str. Gilliam]